MRILIKNIKQLVQVWDENPIQIPGTKMKDLPVIENAWLAIENGKFVDYGQMIDWPGISDWRGLEVIDADGKVVMPLWVDSHTHTVFAGTREGEFVDRINGLSYEEIASRGGGILNSAEKLGILSEEQLFEESLERSRKLMRMGTGALEIKSGYGLSLESELKMLRVIKRLKETLPIPVKATFLGAHAVPSDFKNNKKGYMDEVINTMLPKVAEEGLADYIDIFTEQGYFDLDDTKRVMEAGLKYGLKSKIHVNQFNSIGGIPLAVANNALSVDHLEVLSEEDLSSLKNSSTIPVALPSCSFFLNIPYTPVHDLMAADLPLALATDYNPGSTPSGNMNFVVSLACIKMKMTPEQAINAATVNAAAAMETSSQSGSITMGQAANFFITEKITSYHYLPYSFGENSIESVFVNGELQS